MHPNNGRGVWSPAVAIVASRLSDWYNVCGRSPFCDPYIVLGVLGVPCTPVCDFLKFELFANGARGVLSSPPRKRAAARTSGGVRRARRIPSSPGLWRRQCSQYGTDKLKVWLPEANALLRGQGEAKELLLKLNLPKGKSECGIRYELLR